MKLTSSSHCWYQCKECAQISFKVYKRSPKKIECKHCSGTAEFMTTAMISPVMRESAKQFIDDAFKGSK